MPLAVVHGEYRIEGTEPDGDSVKFYPADQQAFTTLGMAARTNRHGGAQLRLDAIDALETHYTPQAAGASTPQHQPLDLAHAARDRLMTLLGFTRVERREGAELVTSAEPPAAPGYILTRFADIHGRPVALAYAGADSGRRDLSAVHVDPGLLAASSNHALLAEGLAYPTYYSRLYPELRAECSRVVADARAARSGIWGRDVTTTGATIARATDLDETLVLLPKLFRRLVDYLALDPGSVDLAGFRAYLAVRDDQVLAIPDGHLTGLDTFVEVSGDTVRLTRRPEDLVFVETQQYHGR